jgi:uncharacterized ferredoxin-like protein
MLAVTSALMIDADLVLNIPLNEEGKNSILLPINKQGVLS